MFFVSYSYLGILKSCILQCVHISLSVPPSILERHFRHVELEEDLRNAPVKQFEVKRQRVIKAEVRRGQNVVIICAVRGKPKPRIEWHRDRQPIYNDTHHMVMPNGVLLVRGVRTDESGQYKCVAQNPVGTDEGIVSLRVREYRRNVKGMCG